MKVLWNKGEFYTQVYEKPFCTQEPRGFSHREVQKDPVSIKLKLERNQLTKQLYKIANDILGIRFIIKAETAELKQIVHEFVTCCPYGQDACNIVDQTLGKTYDDGYKAIHVYIRPNNYVFPIEIQFWTRTHALLNEYLHEQISLVSH